MSDLPITNWRLLRVAEEICSCLLTDGFCNPKHKSDCRCWTAARAAVAGINRTANPALREAWPGMWSDDERRAKLDLLCKSILSKEDELTKMHRAETTELLGREGEAP